jgi:hypothetical protein
MRRALSGTLECVEELWPREPLRRLTEKSGGLGLPCARSCRVACFGTVHVCGCARTLCWAVRFWNWFCETVCGGDVDALPNYFSDQVFI